MSFAHVKRLARETIRAYGADRAERLAAAVAYYTIFSLAPLLVLGLAVAGVFYGQRSDQAQAELMGQTERVLGPDGTALLERMLEGAAAASSTGFWATLLSTVVLLVGATTLVARLQDALNTIWDTTPEDSGIFGIVRSRAVGLLLVTGAGAIVGAGLVLSSLVTGLADRLAAPLVVRLLDRLLSLALLTLLFAVLYRTLPAAEVRWTDVWPGAALSAALVTLGTWAFGWYLGQASTTSSYGAAGALAGFLLWTYYTAQIFFLGAEFSTVYARHRDVADRPSPTPAKKTPAPASSPPAQFLSWGRRLGWIALGVVLAVFFRRD